MKATLLLSLLAISTLALADDEALLRCRAITDASARLACFDALVVPTPQEKARAAEVTKQEQFGLVKSDRSNPGSDSIDSYIPGHFDGWGPGTSFTLANGQVWVVNDNSRGVHNIDNPKVRVRHGMFTAYYLEIEGTNRSPRVNRVQ
jgi:hypothetical protein